MISSFDPTRLSQARKVLGMTKKELATLIGVSPSAISQFESGNIFPTKENIDLLAKHLKVNIGYFSLGRPTFRSSGSDIHFRSLRSTSARDREKASGYIERLWELVNFLESEIDLPHVDIPLISSKDNHPEFAANKLKEFWEIKPGPVQNLTNLVESHGAIITVLNMLEAEKIGAFSVWANDKPIIAINPERARDIYTQRFTLAHELGHIVMHDEVIPGDKKQEREADLFAAEFLMPKIFFKNEIPSRIDLKKYNMLANHWGVSIESLLYRAKELGISSEQSTRRGFINLNIKKKNKEISYPSPQLYKGEDPQILKKSISIIENDFSIADISEILQIPPKFIRTLIGERDAKPHLSIVR